MLARVVHDALVSDVEALQDELDRAYEQMAKLRDDADLAATNQLRDVLALEAASAEILLRLGRDAVPALIEALADTNPVVRRWAASALGGMGQDAGDAIGALTEAASDPDQDVRRAAKAALDAIARRCCPRQLICPRLSPSGVSGQVFWRRVLNGRYGQRAPNGLMVSPVCKCPSNREAPAHYLLTGPIGKKISRWLTVVTVAAARLLVRKYKGGRSCVPLCAASAPGHSPPAMRCLAF